ncbi:PREDICTED: multidrug resistance-associated protein 4-like, partial [Rhagoletis zephyria]|uniref:multidrug resistance-associated protein 4-like n=1 Tax=Rhagoletis zephyria TaxID=28612 RepID=UPI000811477E
MYAWERSFALRIAKTRAKEVAQVAKACYLQAVNSSTYFIASKLVLFIILLMYVLISGNRLNAEAVFACMSLLNAVQVSMTKYFPRAIGLGAEVRITCKRIEKFLLLEETTSDWESSLKKEKTSAKQNCYKLPKPKSPIVNDPSLTIEHITARWNADPQSQQTLSDISVDRLVNGDLLAVVGSVGSGKSSLLMTLLKELPLQSGTVSVDGSLAYASQEAWSFNDSIRNNILFGAPYEPERYRRVIEVCALKRDLQLLPRADQTLVGEKGVQLSGGQKARVNLARAVYRDADILLLDDPLSAVDATVAEHIFEQCIVGYLANKIRILVTHQLQFVEKATKILVLKEGSILAY